MDKSLLIILSILILYASGYYDHVPDNRDQSMPDIASTQKNIISRLTDKDHVPDTRNESTRDIASTKKNNIKIRPPINIKPLLLSIPMLRKKIQILVNASSTSSS